jgi:hypothetical protein
MPYTLVTEIVKNSDNPWFIDTQAFTTPDKQRDRRDLIIYNSVEREIIKNARISFRNGIEDYIGWEHEWVDDNHLKFSHFFESEASARLYYSRLTQEPMLPAKEIIIKLTKKKKKENNNGDIYEYNWKLYNPDGNELQL